MFGSTISLIESAMNGASLRHRAIASNIANVDTPGYKRLQVSFEDNLSQSVVGLVKTNSKHLPGLKQDTFSPQVKKDETTSMRVDGNNVDIDVEMAELAKNSIYYNTLATQTYQYFSQLRTAIRER